MSSPPTEVACELATGDLTVGVTIEYDGQRWHITEWHVCPAMEGACVVATARRILDAFRLLGAKIRRDYGKYGVTEIMTPRSQTLTPPPAELDRELDREYRISMLDDGFVEGVDASGTDVVYFDCQVEVDKAVAEGIRMQAREA